MIGYINEYLEAIIKVTIFNSVGEAITIDAMVDTGYSGFLALPRNTINELGLSWTGTTEGILADDTEISINVFRGVIVLQDMRAHIDVEEAGRLPLIGMSLLYGQDFEMRVLSGNPVYVRLASQ